MNPKTALDVGKVIMSSTNSTNTSSNATHFISFMLLAMLLSRGALLTWLIVKNPKNKIPPPQ
jgi:hypothetical protein